MKPQLINFPFESLYYIYIICDQQKKVIDTRIETIKHKNL